jgi:DNA-binding response OmpR family regulator
VLLVEEEIDEREMYAQWFRRHGYCTLQAANAADGYRLASELSPDVVITDLRLVGAGDGLDLTRRLKQSSETATVPVVMLSASAIPEDRDAAISVGCDLFLLKPCLPDELARAVSMVMVPPGAGSRNSRANLDGAP